MFSVSPPTYSIIYSKNMPSIWANFDREFEVLQALFFASSYSEKKRWGRGWFILALLYSAVYITVSQISFKLFCSVDKKLSKEFLRK